MDEKVPNFRLLLRQLNTEIPGMERLLSKLTIVFGHILLREIFLIIYLRLVKVV